jgi:hypothetical protein
MDLRGRLETQVLSLVKDQYAVKDVDVRCPPTTGRALKPCGEPLVVSYQSPKGWELKPSAAHFFTEVIRKSRRPVSVTIAAVQISQSVLVYVCLVSRGRPNGCRTVLYQAVSKMLRDKKRRGKKTLFQDVRI